MQCLFEIDAGVVKVALEVICVANIVEAKGIFIEVIQIALNLQRLLEKFKRLIVLAPITIKLAQVEQDAACILLVADFTVGLQRIVVAFQGEVGFP